MVGQAPPYVYDSDRIVQKLDGSGNLVAEWVYGTYIDEVLAMHRDTCQSELFPALSCQY